MQLPFHPLFERGDFGHGDKRGIIQVLCQTGQVV
tara:strand:+ start:514 stop:615 length:102 start_codon:yes stop_codon:yes gene_type:complete